MPRWARAPSPPGRDHAATRSRGPRQPRGGSRASGERTVSSRGDLPPPRVRRRPPRGVCARPGRVAHAARAVGAGQRRPERASFVERVDPGRHDGQLAALADRVDLASILPEDRPRPFGTPHVRAVRAVRRLVEVRLVRAPPRRSLALERPEGWRVRPSSPVRRQWLRRALPLRQGLLRRAPPSGREVHGGRAARAERDPLPPHGRRLRLADVASRARASAAAPRGRRACPASSRGPRRSNG